jgi:hypothetical protein
MLAYLIPPGSDVPDTLRPRLAKGSDLRQRLCDLSVEKPLLEVNVRQIDMLVNYRLDFGITLRVVARVPGGEYTSLWTYQTQGIETVGIEALEESFALDRQERERELAIQQAARAEVGMDDTPQEEDSIL